MVTCSSKLVEGRARLAHNLNSSRKSHTRNGPADGEPKKASSDNGERPYTVVLHNHSDVDISPCLA